MGYTMLAGYLLLIAVRSPRERRKSRCPVAVGARSGGGYLTLARPRIGQQALPEHGARRAHFPGVDAAS